MLSPYFAEYGVDISAIPAGPGRLPFSGEVADVLEEFRPAVVSFHFGLPRTSNTRVREGSMLGHRGIEHRRYLPDGFSTSEV